MILAFPEFPALKTCVPADHQYVERPPEMSNTAPVENEHSRLATHAISDATSSVVPNRPAGIFESMKSMCDWVICEKIGVRTAAGVTTFAVTPLLTSSFASDFVIAMTA